MKVLFITNYPSPYRVEFFNLLGKQCDLSVCFLNTPEEQTHRSDKWFNTDYSGFQAVFLTKQANKLGIKKDIIKILKQNFDIIVFGGYSNPTQMYAMEYLYIHRIPYYIEADGGLIKKDKFIKKLIKKHFIGRASGCIGSGSITREYFAYYGAKDKNIYDYCFTSQKESDLIEALVIADDDRRVLRDNLSVSESVIISTNINSEFDINYDVIKQIANSDKEKIGLYILTNNSDFSESLYEECSNIHVIKTNSEYETAKYLASSDIYINLNDTNSLSSFQAKIFGLPIVQGYFNETNNNDENISSINKITKSINSAIYDKEYKQKLLHESLSELDRVIRSKDNSAIEVKSIELLRYTIRYIAKTSLGIDNRRIVITVGQFIYRKGFDILLKSSSDIDADIYIIGGKPDSSYEQLNNGNVHFIDFLTKNELRQYYRAADVFAMPTREDIWGLVVNEALSYGLPVVSTDKCVAGLELINQGENGYIVPVEDSKALAISINDAFDLNAVDSYKCIKKYTLENMTKRHLDIFKHVMRNSNG